MQEQEQARVRAFPSAEADRRLVVVETVLSLHVQQCDKRALLAQKLMLVAVTTNLVVLGTLISKLFHWG